MYPSVGKHHPPAMRLERTINDLFGLSREGSPDSRPGSITTVGACAFRWAIASTHCRGRRPTVSSPAEGDGLHQIAVGPVHAGIIEPGHFRFTASGETVVRLEQRLGYTHKGIEGLMRGASLERGAQLAGRVSGDSTVAYAYAFSKAIEAALQLAVPDRAVWLRALLAELERLANHLGDIGAICNDASFGLMQAHCNVLREDVLRASNIAFGHRLMRDVIVPGGLARDLDEKGRRASVRRSTISMFAFPHLSNSTTTPPRFRIAPSAPASSRRRWQGNMPREAMWGAHPGAPSMPAGLRVIPV